MVSVFHILLKIKTKNSNNLTDENKILNLIKDLSKLLRTQILDESSHKFGPSGFTAYALLSESHIAVHTWPEENLVIIDILSCKKVTPEFKPQLEEKIGIVFDISESFIDISEIWHYICQAK